MYARSKKSPQAWGLKVTAHPGDLAMVIQLKQKKSPSMGIERGAEREVSAPTPNH